MGALKVTVRTATAAAALAVTALTPAAYAAAADGRGVSVAPPSPAPGTDVTLRVSGCASRTAVAVSEAFVADARLTGADGTLVGETRVRTSAAPGAHTVRVTCADVQVDGTVRVAAAPAAQGPDRPPPPPRSRPSPRAAGAPRRSPSPTPASRAPVRPRR